MADSRWHGHDAGPPIFVVGTPRSGTTLTARILGRHSALFMPGETHFMDDVYARRRQLGEPSRIETVRAANQRLRTIYARFNEPDDQVRVDDLFRRRGLELARPVADWRALFTRFMALQMGDTGRARWGNQVPRDIFNVEALLALWPDARFVVCIRDPRDFLASYRGKAGVAATAVQARRAELLYHPVVTARIWNATLARVAWMRRRLSPAQWLQVRYEELVGDTEHVVQAICRTVDLPFEATVLQVRGNNSSVPANRAAPGGIFTHSVGRWRRDLPAADALLAQYVAGRRMREFGYAPEPLHAGVARPVLVAAQTPWAVYRGLRANRHLRGPLLPYLAKRLLPCAGCLR
jgi:hypothetical protein